MACSIYRLAPKSRIALARAEVEGGPKPMTVDGRSKAETYEAIIKALDKFLAKYPVDVTGR